MNTGHEGWMGQNARRRNIIIIVLDDVGFGHLGCYGSSIRTPHMDALAARGTRFASFHTTALCAPTRSALLSGRNHHRNGMGTVPLRATNDPGYTAHTPRAHGYLSEVLSAEGYATVAIGKWHLTPYPNLSAAGPFEQWPLGRGFDHFYGFMHAETDHWRPRLVRDNTFIDPSDRSGYHLTEDLVDEALRQIRDVRTADPSKPYFLYFGAGAAHAPLHVPAEYVQEYRGAFDHGWRVEAERVLERQQTMGLVPRDVELPAWPTSIPEWNSLDDDQRQVAIRLQEVLAGFLTHLDEHVGRLLAAVDDMGEADDTMVVLLSDNGASGEGGSLGTVNELRRLNRIADSDADNLSALERMGQRGTFPHYPTGWALAGNTPFRNMKKYVHEGGIADPLVVNVPWLAGATDGGLRRQYHHVTDIAPTVLELLDVAQPAHVRGVPQESLDGCSFAYALGNPQARRRKHIQYYESMGHRALWRDGWKVVTDHVPQSGVGEYETDLWHLFHTDTDPTESRDLSTERPDLLAELTAAWHEEARRNQVLPMDDSRTRDPVFSSPGAAATKVRYYAGGRGVQQWTTPSLRRQPFQLAARLRGDVDGPVFVHGGLVGGLGLAVVRGELIFLYNVLDLRREQLRVPLLPDEVGVRLELRPDESTGAEVVLIAGEEEARRHLNETVQLRFDAEGATYVGRDPFGVFDGLCPTKERHDVAHVDLEILGMVEPDREGELQAERLSQ